jgi:long-chain acyl-CoA synthetase
MTRLFDLRDYQLKNTPIEASINGRNKDGNWESYSTQKLKDTAED